MMITVTAGVKRFFKLVSFFDDILLPVDDFEVRRQSRNKQDSGTAAYFILIANYINLIIFICNIQQILYTSALTYNLRKCQNISIPAVISAASVLVASVPARAAVCIPGQIVNPVPDLPHCKVPYVIGDYFGGECLEFKKCPVFSE